MEGVGSFLGPAGGCPEVTLGDKTWKIGHPTQRAKATLERLAVSTATREIMALRDILEPEDFQIMLDGFRDDVAAKKYRTWGEGWKKTTFAPMNSHLFLLSLLRENHPDATEKDAKALALANTPELEIAIAQVVPDFFSMLLADSPFTEEQKAAFEAKVPEILSQLFKSRKSQQSQPEQSPKPTTPTNSI